MLSYRLELEQKQILSQQQQQSLEILAMHTAELKQFLEYEYMENPLLEHEEERNEVIQVRDISDFYESRVCGWDNYSESAESEVKYEIPDQKKESLRDLIWWQINEKICSKQERAMIELLIQYLEPNGYISEKWVELKQIPHADPGLLDDCLQLLQTLDPPGMFARDVRECLKLQLKRNGITSGPVMQIVDEFLNEVASGKISVISRRLKLSTLEVRRCIAQIELLNPRPFLDFTNEKSEFIIPDVIVRWTDGEWKIDLNDEWIQNYHVNSYYMEMLERTEDAELTRYFSEKSKRVCFIMGCIKQRRDTLSRMVSFIVKEQESYLLKGMPLKPMTMSQIAESMQVNVSTISRAVKGKYVQYPRGSILMKDLFAVAICNELHQEEYTTSQAVKDKIHELINNEDKENPYSDEQLHHKFKEQGIQISRRTVAKYREELGIKTSYSRKHFS